MQQLETIVLYGASTASSSPKLREAEEIMSSVGSIQVREGRSTTYAPDQR